MKCECIIGRPGMFESLYYVLTLKYYFQNWDNYLGILYNAISALLHESDKVLSLKYYF